jgi:hypothetical protein
MEPWTNADRYPQDDTFAGALSGDLAAHRERLAARQTSEAEDVLCLRLNEPDEIEILKDNPVTITDISKYGGRIETVSADATNGELLNSLRNVSITGVLPVA